MESKKGVNLTFVIIAFILGLTLFNHFDFKTYRFKMPALDILFLIVFIIAIYLLIKDYKKQPEK